MTGPVARRGEPIMEVRDSGVHGLGVFALRRIRQGTRVIEYLGERVSHKEATVVLKGARKMALEACLEYIEDDELVEITPGSVRTRKRILEESMRKRSERQSRDREEARV